MIRPNHNELLSKNDACNENILQYGFLKKQRKAITRKLTGQNYHWHFALLEDKTLYLYQDETQNILKKVIVLDHTFSVEVCLEEDSEPLSFLLTNKKEIMVSSDIISSNSDSNSDSFLMSSTVSSKLNITQDSNVINEKSIISVILSTEDYITLENWMFSLIQCIHGKYRDSENFSIKDFNMDFEEYNNNNNNNNIINEKLNDSKNVKNFLSVYDEGRLFPAWHIYYVVLNMECEIDNFTILKNNSTNDSTESIDKFDIHNKLNSKFNLKKEIINLVNFNENVSNKDNIINKEYNNNINIDSKISNNSDFNNNINIDSISNNSDFNNETNESVVNQQCNCEYYKSMSIDSSTLVVSIPQELSKKPHCFSLVSIRNNVNIVRDSSMYYNDSFDANNNIESIKINSEGIIPLFDDRKRNSLRLAANNNENKELFISNIIEIILKSRFKNEKFKRRNSKLPIGRRFVTTVLSKPLRRVSAYVDSVNNNKGVKSIQEITRRKTLL